MAGKFKYKLDALKKLRELKLNMAKVELAMVASQVSACDQKIATSRESVSVLLDDQRQTFDMQYVKLFSHLTSVEQDRIEIEMDKRNVLQADMDRHSAYVAFLRSELKAVEHHEAAKKEEFKKENDKLDAKKIDELTSIIWNRKSGANQ